MKGNAAWDRAGATSGIAFALLTLMGITVWVGQETIVGPENVAGQIAITVLDLSTEIRFGAMLILVGVFFLFWFMAFLRHRLEQQPSAAWIASVAYGGGMVAGTAVVAIRSGALPGWLGWLSIPLVIAPVVLEKPPDDRRVPRLGHGRVGRQALPNLQRAQRPPPGLVNMSFQDHATSCSESPARMSFRRRSLRNLPENPADEPVARQSEPRRRD